MKARTSRVLRLVLRCNMKVRVVYATPNDADGVDYDDLQANTIAGTAEYRALDPATNNHTYEMMQAWHHGHAGANAE